MARIKRSLNAKKKRRRTLKMAKGYFGAVRAATVRLRSRYVTP